MSFTTPLKVELISHSANKGSVLWKLIAPLGYIDKAETFWIVPAGFKTDFASVPRIPFAYWLTGGTAHKPAVLHDYLCREKLVSREQADRLFLEAMEELKMPKWRSYPMYAAVAAYTGIGKAWNRIWRTSAHQ